jgi:hypothetical protein
MHWVVLLFLSTSPVDITYLFAANEAECKSVAAELTQSGSIAFCGVARKVDITFEASSQEDADSIDTLIGQSAP